jgi:hypothetical protein
MNPKDYKDKKARGLAEVVTAGDGFAFAVKRFSSDDGAELTPEIESIDADDLIARKTELEAEIADYTTLIADVDKLKSSGK